MNFINLSAWKTLVSYFVLILQWRNNVLREKNSIDRNTS